MLTSIVTVETTSLIAQMHLEVIMSAISPKYMTECPVYPVSFWNWSMVPPA